MKSKRREINTGNLGVWEREKNVSVRTLVVWRDRSLIPVGVENIKEETSSKPISQEKRYKEKGEVHRKKVGMAA